MPTSAPGLGNPQPDTHRILDLPVLRGLHETFGGSDDELSFVEIAYFDDVTGVSMETKIFRNGRIQQASGKTPMRRR